MNSVNHRYDAAEFIRIDSIPAERIVYLHMLLTYPYPVHRISPRFKPEAQEITYLLAFRTLDYEIKFDVLNAVSARLVQRLALGALTGGRRSGKSPRSSSTRIRRRLSRAAVKFCEPCACEARSWAYGESGDALLSRRMHCSQHKACKFQTRFRVFCCRWAACPSLFTRLGGINE